MVGFGGQPAGGREEPSESAKVDREAVCDPEAGGGGSVQEGESEPGWAGGGWVHDRGVRDRAAGQVVRDLEPDVLGVVCSAAGEGCRGAEAAWRGHADARGADR